MYTGIWKLTFQSLINFSYIYIYRLSLTLNTNTAFLIVDFQFIHNQITQSFRWCFEFYYRTNKIVPKASYLILVQKIVHTE